MAEEADLLRTIAQISIAFAGFAGVVAAFGKFRLAPEVAVFRVRMMVRIALATMDRPLMLGNGHGLNNRR